MKVIQLQPDYFYNFQTSQCFRFANVPFTKIKNIQLEAGTFSVVSFKASFANDFNEVPIVVNNTRQKTKQTMPKICKLSKSTELTNDKIKDLRSMTKYRPADDRTYYEVMLKKS